MGDVLVPKVKVGVTGTGSLIGQAIIKCIRHSSICDNIFLVGFDYFPNTVGSYWTENTFMLPDFLKKEITEQQWLNEIVRIIKSQKIQIFLVGIDFELELFSKYRAVIKSETNCTVVVSDPEVIRIANDKYLTYCFLKDNGLPCPDSILPEETTNRNIGFPCVVKPRIGSRSREVFVVNDREELEEKMRRVNNVIIQELAGNPNEEYSCGVICLDNEVKEMIALKRVLKDGNTVTAYFSEDTPATIYDYVRQIAIKLKPFGACNIQLRLDNKRIPRAFEINPRHSGTTYMRALFGFNEVEYILSYLLKLKVKKFAMKEGIVKRYYDELFIETE
jgi:carbamoyl-phosphate synthase large subunit